MLAGRLAPRLAVRERAGMSGAALSAAYEIRVEGVLDRRWTAESAEPGLLR